VNFQQLRSFRETVRQGFNLTGVAEALNTSQPGVSRQLKELEEELGVELFIRSGRRFLGLTEPGKAALPFVERLLQEAENFRRVGADFASADDRRHAHAGPLRTALGSEGLLHRASAGLAAPDAGLAETDCGTGASG
jgi:DNA-binding transcriptional LysR family regulator